MYYLSYICTFFLAALKRPGAFCLAFHREIARVQHWRLPCAARELAACAALQPNLQAPSFPARFRFGPYANGPP